MWQYVASTSTTRRICVKQGKSEGKESSEYVNEVAEEERCNLSAVGFPKISGRFEEGPSPPLEARAGQGGPSRCISGLESPFQPVGGGPGLHFSLVFLY